jgi:RHS repeat-associated protein
MVSPESVGTGNELTKSPGVTYTYDNNGNMSTATTVSGTTTYTYDYENRLTNVDIHGTMAATYAYDALGRRIGIDDSGTQTWTVFNGKSADANPYADFTSSGTLKMRYLDGLAVDELLARTDASGNTSWYLTDQVGSVVAIASTSAVLDQITYDPFGNIVTQTDSAEADRFMFAGLEYDSTTGLYYDHARYYDAAIGRFVSQDPKGFAAGDANLYRYVQNNPAAATDPSGTQDDPITIIIKSRWENGWGVGGVPYIGTGDGGPVRIYPTSPVPKPVGPPGGVQFSPADPNPPYDGPPIDPTPLPPINPEPPPDEAPPIVIENRIHVPIKPTIWNVPPGEDWTTYEFTTVVQGPISIP